MFWEKFLNLCNSKKITPNGLAKILGISSGTITNWKNGVIPQDRIKKKVADYFDVEIDYFNDNTKAEANLDKNEKYLIEKYRSTTNEGRARIIKSVQDIVDEIEKKK